eukprot:scaffold29690_cov59-Attheya_sp.AAC.8
MDPMDGEFASFERTNVNNDTDVADESKTGTVMIDGTKKEERHLRDIRAMREMAGHVQDMSTRGVIHEFAHLVEGTIEIC